MQRNAYYLELLFLTVFAFPNASRTGLDCDGNITCVIQSNKNIVVMGILSRTRHLRNYHLKDLLLHGSPFRSSFPTHVSKISHDHLGAFRFTSTTFSTNKNGLAYSFVAHQSATVKEKVKMEIMTLNFFYGEYLLDYV